MIDLTNAQRLGKLVNELEQYIRTGNKELGLRTLGLIRDALGNRIAQDSMDKNLQAYEEAMKRFNEPKAEPAVIGGFGIPVLEPEPVAKRGRPKKGEMIDE